MQRIEENSHLVFKAFVHLEFDTVSYDFPTGVKSVDKHDSRGSQISTDIDGEEEMFPFQAVNMRDEQQTQCQKFPDSLGTLR